MKFGTGAALLLPCLANAFAGHGAAAHVRVGEVGAREVVNPQDILSCVGSVGELFNGASLNKDYAVERVVDQCAIDKRIDDNNYVCTHLREVLMGAFQEYGEDQQFTPPAFCDVAEQYMIGLRGAARVPGVGSGALLNFKISPTCAQSVSAAFDAGQSSCPATDVPELWYNLCANAGCQHYLPSRTRWCKLSRGPTHSMSVCADLQRYVRTRVGRDQSAMDANAICNVYADFAHEMGHNIQAYEHVVHSEDSKGVPSPEDHHRALRSSKLVNTAGRHDLRDGTGQNPAPVYENTKSVKRIPMPVILLIVVFVIWLVAFLCWRERKGEHGYAMTAAPRRS